MQKFNITQIKKMKKETLLIGSLVLYRDKICRITYFHPEMVTIQQLYGEVISTEYEMVFPVKLNENIIYGFGFSLYQESHDHAYIKEWGDNGFFGIRESCQYMGYEYELGKGRLKIIQSAHELQLLYTAITGDVLTFKKIKKHV